MTDLYHMYSTLWMNQFKIKDACIEFMTNNASLQDNNVKMKIDLKVENIFL